jgi:hypothetical protein
VIRPLLLVIGLLLIAGCDTARRINPGATGVAIWVAAPLRLEQEAIKRGGPIPFGQQLGGFYDRQANELWLDGTLDKWSLLAKGIHEVGHTVELPELWRVIYGMSAPSFNTFSTAHDPEVDMRDPAAP